MDQSEQTQQQQQPVMGVVAGAGQMSYTTNPYQTAAMMASGTPAIAVPSPTQPPTTFSNSPSSAYLPTGPALPPSTAAAAATAASNVLGQPNARN